MKRIVPVVITDDEAALRDMAQRIRAAFYLGEGASDA